MRRNQRGVTMIELILAITLVSAITAGLMTAMRLGVTSLEKTQTRLQDNRRTMGIQQAILRQIGGVIPTVGDCGVPGGPITRVPGFNGTPVMLRLVSSYSLNQGFRGLPQVVEYQVEPEPGGTFRLILNERLYFGPASTGPLCAGGNFLPVQHGPATVVLATKLAYCRFFYHERLPDALDSGAWVSVWNRPNLPSAVRIEMAPAVPNPTQLPMVSLHIPIHITRDVGALYTDQ